MPRVGPTKRRDLIGYLRALGYDGPHSGGSHEFMLKGKQHVQLPNPHGADVSVGFLRQLLKEAGIERDVRERL